MLTEDTQIREACNDDLNGIVNLLSQLSQCEGNEEKLQQELDKILKDDKYCLIVAENKNKMLVGTAMLVERLNLSHQGRPVAYIENVVVDSDYRSKGIGIALMEELKKLAYFKKCYKITLDCTASAMHFYRNFNFHRTDEVNMRYDIHP